MVRNFNANQLCSVFFLSTHQTVHLFDHPINVASSSRIQNVLKCGTLHPSSNITTATSTTHTNNNNNNDNLTNSSQGTLLIVQKCCATLHPRRTPVSTQHNQFPLKLRTIFSSSHRHSLPADHHIDRSSQCMFFVIFFFFFLKSMSTVCNCSCVCVFV